MMYMINLLIITLKLNPRYRNWYCYGKTGLSVYNPYHYIAFLVVVNKTSNLLMVYFSVFLNDFIITLMNIS